MSYAGDLQEASDTSRAATIDLIRQLAESMVANIGWRSRHVDLPANLLAWRRAVDARNLSEALRLLETLMFPELDSFPTLNGSDVGAYDVHVACAAVMRHGIEWVDLTANSAGGDA